MDEITLKHRNHVCGADQDDLNYFDQGYEFALDRANPNGGKPTMSYSDAMCEVEGCMIDLADGDSAAAEIMWEGAASALAELFNRRRAPL